MSNHSNHPSDEENPEQEASDEESEVDYSPTLWDYLNSKNGHEIAQQVVAILAQIKNVTIDAIARERKENLEFQKRVRREQWIVQLVVFTLSLILVGVLTWVNKSDSAVAVLLGTLVGYFFGRSQQR